MTAGICFISFGPEFDRLGAATATYSRRFTGLPMHVLTNLPESERHKWPEGTTFTHLDMPTEHNRMVKVSLLEYTPFDDTLFCDADSVIQTNGITRFFRDLEQHDVCCQLAETLPNAERRAKSKFYRTFYLALMEKVKARYPLDIMQSSAFLFRKNDAAKAFFKMWRLYWSIGGGRRDMPGFSLAARDRRVKVKVYQAREDRFLANGKNRGRVIQHRGYRQFLADFGLPEYKDWNP